MTIAISVLLYLSAWVLLLMGLSRHEILPPRKVLLVIAAGILVHGLSIAFDWRQDQAIPLGFFNVASLFFFVINTIVALSTLKKPLYNVFIILLPLTVISLIIGKIFYSPTTLPAALPKGILAHILLSILAYSLLTIATFQALLLAYQNAKLKNKHPRGVMGLMPPLQTMENLLFELVWAGMIFLTLSIATGFVFVEDMLAQHLAHKTVFSLLSWVIYATLLAGRHFAGWRGAVALRWVLGGFAALMLAYFGSKLVLEVILQRV